MSPDCSVTYVSGLYRVPANNAMNQTNRGVPGLKEWRASGEPMLAEVGAPFILSLGIAGYHSVMRHHQVPACAR